MEMLQRYSIRAGFDALLGSITMESSTSRVNQNSLPTDTTLCMAYLPCMVHIFQGYCDVLDICIKQVPRSTDNVLLVARTNQIILGGKITVFSRF